MEIKPLRENNRIYIDRNGNLYTKNLVPGQRVYEEKLVKFNGIEYRQWIINRSKLAAAIKKGIGNIPIKENDRILYLGIAAGTTASHISDIIGENGRIFGIDIAGRILRELEKVVEKRKNIIPILSDANKPETYLHIVPKVDIIYQDVAQPNQVDIFIKNIEYYLKNNGYGFLAVKSRSIDVKEKPKKIFEKVRQQLQDFGLEIIKEVLLDPYHIDHSMFLIRNK